MIKKISEESWPVLTAVEEVYADLVKSQKLFNSYYHLFSAGLVYGLLHKKQHTVRPSIDFTKLLVIGDDSVKRVIDLVFCVLDDGRDPKEIWQDMLYIADGGVLALNNIYKSNNNFRIPHLLQEIQKVLPERIMDLHNINLGRSDQ